MFLGLGCACLLAFGLASAPRLFLILAWIFNSPKWAIVWQGGWIIPLLGIIFLPFTTIMYMLSWMPGVGVAGWSWLWVIMGVLLDVMQWGSVYERRKEIPGVSQYGGGAA